MVELLFLKEKTRKVREVVKVGKEFENFKKRQGVGLSVQWR